MHAKAAVATLQPRGHDGLATNSASGKRGGEQKMDQLPAILQRLISTNELMAYAVMFVGFLTFLGLVISVLGLYRASVQHREAIEVLKEIRGASDRLGYYLFRKLGPIELP
jgi:hypothetical protein